MLSYLLHIETDNHYKDKEKETESIKADNIKGIQYMESVKNNEIREPFVKEGQQSEGMESDWDDRETERDEGDE